MAATATMAPSSAALSEIARSVRASTQMNTQTIRQYAETQNDSMGRMVKDLYRTISAGNRGTSSLQSSMAENAAETGRVASKMDSMNGLLQQTLSLQSTMLYEMKALNSGFKALSTALRENMGGGLLGSAANAVGGIGSSLVAGAKTMAALGALGLGGAAGFAAYKEHLSNLGRESGGEGSNVNANSNANGYNPVERSGGSGSGARPSSKEIYDYLIGKGLDHNQAIGMLSNVARETGGTFDAGLVNENDAGDGPSGGLFQHHDSRRDGSRRFTQMKQFAGPNWKQNWKGQIDFALQESDGQRYLAQRYGSPEEATAAFYRKFERGANESSDLAKSQKWLEKWAKEGFGNPGQQQNNANRNLTPPAPAPQTPSEATPQQQSNSNNGNRNPLIQNASLVPNRDNNLVPPNTRTPGAVPNDNQRQNQQGGGQVFEDQLNAPGIVRNQPINERLKRILQIAGAEAGVDVRVASGGQPSSGPNRRGSDRHDNGNAADLDLYVGNRKLSPKNPEDLPLFKKFVATAKAEGATGFGAGEGYMGNDGSRIHVGFGTEAIWGKSRSNDTAADWLREATGGPGAPAGSQTAQAQMQQGSQNRADGLNQIDPMGLGGFGMLGPMAMPLGGMGGFGGMLPLVGALQGLIGALSTPQTPNPTGAYDPRVDGNNNPYPSWYDRFSRKYNREDKTDLG